MRLWLLHVVLMRYLVWMAARATNNGLADRAESPDVSEKIQGPLDMLRRLSAAILAMDGPS